MTYIFGIDTLIRVRFWDALFLGEENHRRNVPRVLEYFQTGRVLGLTAVVNTVILLINEYSFGRFPNASQCTKHVHVLYYVSCSLQSKIAHSSLSDTSLWMGTATYKNSHACSSAQEEHNLVLLVQPHVDATRHDNLKKNRLNRPLNRAHISC